jgi:hypothetical protein
MFKRQAKPNNTTSNYVNNNNNNNSNHYNQQLPDELITEFNNIINDDEITKKNSTIPGKINMIKVIFLLGIIGSIIIILAILKHYGGGGLSSSYTFIPPKHAPGVSVVNFARHDLPPVILGERVIDLMSGVHFDNLLQDTPDEMRPPSLILFIGFETCGNIEKQLKYKTVAETILPSRERLLIGRYDMDANPSRPWYKFTPEMDLKSRYGVKKCGELVYVPRKCNGFITWCERKANDPLLTKAGCANFIDPCASLVQKYDTQQRDGLDWVVWVNKLIEKDGLPHISPVLGSYHDQERWIRDRDDVTTDNEMRNYYLVEAFPAFTTTGYAVMPIPVPVNNWLMSFWENGKHFQRTRETWHAASTQLSFHEKPTHFISLDQDHHTRDEMARKYIQPLVEKWSGISPLELTSFYGIREYHDESWLRNHIDRIDTHVLSVTFSLGKVNISDPMQLLTPEQFNQFPTWPLEVISFDGEIHRHAHLPGQMILYESSALIHGRPFRNLGPGHLGAFVHFKPVHTLEQAGEWDNICSRARLHQKHSGKYGTYKSTPIQEIDNPIFTTHPFAEHTGFESHHQNHAVNNNVGGKKKTTQQHLVPFAVRFINDSGRTLDLAWLDTHTNKLHHIGTIASGSSLEQQSYLGHKFQWLEKSGQPAPEGLFEVEAGSHEIRYGVRK